MTLKQLALKPLVSLGHQIIIFTRLGVIIGCHTLNIA
jgi:hypothetical protein